METTSAPEPGAGAEAERAVTKGPILPRVLALVVSIALTAAIIIFREQVARFSTYGYAGVFVISLVGNATVFLPVPSLVAIFAGGTALNPIITGLVAGVAEPLGEITGYLAGYGGSAVIENRARYERMRDWMRRHGVVTIFVLSALPNPLFDLAGITAGALRMPVWQFLLACWLGKTTKALAVAWLGSQSMQWLGPLLQRFGG